ncbi:MAG: lysophospholipid acyltransferase family protein [Actinomycetota bacterium]
MSTLREDVKQISRGWRWGRRALTPHSVPLAKTEPRDFPTAWARTPAARAVRSAVQRGVMEPLMKWETKPHVFGLEILESVREPVVFYANHSSHLDAPMLLTALPPSWRERTAVGAAADYFFDVWWRAAATALFINAFPVERAGARKSTRLAREMLAHEWNILVFPEGTRSHDGWVGEFRSGAARLCVDEGVPAVPIAVRGTYQAMPRGRSWPAPDRKPVSIRFGKPVTAQPGENALDLNTRMRGALVRLLDEDRTTWWDAIRRDARDETPDGAGPDAAPWRRVWEASRPIPRTDRPKAWR